jgi:hypothetical protein
MSGSVTSASYATNASTLDSKSASTFATTGSNTFVGTQTHSGSILPAVDNTYDLGSATYQWRDVYVSSGSLYIDGSKVLSSTTNELQITTDIGQSIKILEAGSDNITLQSADGNIELKTSGGGDVILDPTTGVIALKGTTTLYNGNKIVSSDGNAVQFGNSLAVTGSVTSTSTITATSFTGSLLGTASIAASATSASYALKAVTASYADSLTVAGTLTAQTLVVQTITSSVDFVTGSTRFGSLLANTHIFTGSIGVTGSLTLGGGLSSTSATFSGAVQNTSGSGFQSSVEGGFRLRNDANSGNLGGLTRRSYWAGGAALDTQIFAETGYGIYLNVNGGTSSGLTLASTGAATFTNSVAINGVSLDINPSSGNSNITLRTANVFEGYIQAITGGGILFGTGASATERMRITSTGRVGVGKSNPDSTLDVYGTGAIKNNGATNIFTKEFNRETSNQTHTIATVTNTAGNNSRVFLKLTILSTSAVTNIGNAQTAYAFWSADGTRQVSSVSLDYSFGGDTYVVSLAWSGDNLQVTTTAPFNYQNYMVNIQAVQRDGAIIT